MTQNLSDRLVGNFYGNVEYAYNTDTTNASDTTSFGYGPEGTTVPATTLTSARDKTVRFKTPIAETDVLLLQVNSGGVGDDNWLPLSIENTGGVALLQQQGSVLYGMGVIQDTSDANQIRVRFGQYRLPGATYAGAGSNWTGQTKWRVLKASKIQYQANDVNADTLRANTIENPAGDGGPAIKGRTDGAPGAGEIGEYLESIGSGTSPTSNVFGDGGNSGLTLGEGTYDIHAITVATIGSATLNEAYVGVGTASGTSTTGLDSNRNTLIIPFGGISANSVRVASPTFRVTVSAGTTQTFYPKTRYVFSASTISVASSIFARRIA